MNLPHSAAHRHNRQRIIVDLADSTASEKRPATKKFLHEIEAQAGELRRLAKADLLQKLDPLKLTATFRIRIMDATKLPMLLDEDPDFFATIDVKKWSGFAQRLPTNEVMVILHPYQTPERARVTLLEEIAHLHYNHASSRLVSLSSGLIQRTFNARIEQEAYWTAAAALLPAYALAQAVWRHESVQQIATMFGTSVELVQFRLKILSLWTPYKAYSAGKN